MLQYQIITSNKLHTILRKKFIDKKKKNHSIFFRILPDRAVYRRKIKSINDFSPDGLHNFVLSAEFPIPSRSVAVLCPVRLMSLIAIEQNGNAELIAETRLGLGREIRGNFALLSESRRFNQRHLFSPPPQQTAVENR